MDNHLTALANIKTYLLKQLEDNRNKELELADSYGEGDVARDFHFARAATYSRRIMKMKNELQKFKKENHVPMQNLFTKENKRFTSADYRQIEK